MDILNRIKNNESFLLKVMTASKLRRMPRTQRILFDMWNEITVYSIDATRSTEDFLLFVGNNRKYNWWIDINQKEVCYDASGHLPYIVRDKLNEFEFIFSEKNKKI